MKQFRAGSMADELSTARRKATSAHHRMRFSPQSRSQSIRPHDAPTRPDGERYLLLRLIPQIVPIISALFCRSSHRLETGSNQSLFHYAPLPHTGIQRLRGQVLPFLRQSARRRKCSQFWPRRQWEAIHSRAHSQWDRANEMVSRNRIP